MKRGGREHYGACDVYNVVQSEHQFRYQSIYASLPWWAFFPTVSDAIWRGSYPTMAGAIEALDPFQSARVESLKGARLMTELCAMVGV